MININWEGDKQLHDALSYVESRIDKKLSWGLNGLAYQAQQQVKQELPSWLNMGRGANFIKQSVVYDKSTPDNLSATIGFLDRAWLAPLLEAGGKRTPQRKAIGVPASEKPMVKNIKAAYAKGAFSAKIGGIDGLWLRKKTKKMSTLNLLYSWQDQTNYKPQQLHFEDTVTQFFEQNIDSMVKKSVEELVARFNSK